jgi:hypothetical protein
MYSSIIAQVLSEMGVSLPQRKFLQQLFPTWLAVRGRFNFMNVSRYGPWHERSLRRGFGRGFLWPEFNSRLLAKLLPVEQELIAALDASFVPKSGKETFGLGYFFNSCVGRAPKGLEVSLVSIVDLTRNTAYALSARQTPPEQSSSRPAKKTVDQKGAGQKIMEKETRIDAYLEHFQAVRSLLPKAVRHLAVDGYFTNYKFVQGVAALRMEVVGKLRKDANLRYLYKGSRQGRGRPRLYDGKVQWSKLDRRRWKNEGEVEKGVRLYSAALNHVSLKRTVRVVLLQKTTPGKPQYALLFSTDLQLSGHDIVRYYKARFQIEFLFRDAKQGTGLNDCQARNEQALQFHWNAALCAVNLAKWQEAQCHRRQSFSVASCKLRHSNEQLLEVFSHSLGLDWMAIKSHPAYASLCNYGAIQP